MIPISLSEKFCCQNLITSIKVYLITGIKVTGIKAVKTLLRVLKFILLRVLKFILINKSFKFLVTHTDYLSANVSEKMF